MLDKKGNRMGIISLPPAQAVIPSILKMYDPVGGIMKIRKTPHGKIIGIPKDQGVVFVTMIIERIRSFPTSHMI
jgi:hypothetical protein